MKSANCCCEAAAGNSTGIPLFQISVAHFKLLSEPGHLFEPKAKVAQLKAHKPFLNSSFE